MGSQDEGVTAFQADGGIEASGAGGVGGGSDAGHDTDGFGDGDDVGQRVVLQDTDRRLPLHPLVAEGGGAVLVVGQAVDVDRDARGAVALVGDLGVDGGVGTGAKGLVDGGLDLCVGHGDHAGTGHGGSQGGVVVGVGVAAELGRNGDVAGELGEQRGALSVDSGLLVLSGSPLRVSGHADLLWFAAAAPRTA